MVLTGR
jgi:hypothetical protein